MSSCLFLRTFHKLYNGNTTQNLICERMVTMTEKQARRIAFTLTAISKIVAGVYVIYKIDEVSNAMLHPIQTYRKWRNKKAKEIKL